MNSTGTYYEPKELASILDRVFTLIRQGRATDADSLLEEYDLREFVCGAD